MSREIEFRVWDNANKKMHKVCWVGWEGMIYCDDIEDKGQVRPSSISAEIPQPDGGFIEEYFSPENDILMQYTGIKDKNGVKIFDGDKFLDHFSNEYGLIFKDDSRACFMAKINEYLYDDFGSTIENIIPMYELDFNDIEVIGNIHEDKEFLNDK